MQQATWGGPGLQARASTSSQGSPVNWPGPWPVTMGTGKSDRTAEPACPPDCALHSQAAHDASMLLRKINAFPARYVELWQPDGTDDVLRWLHFQNPAASPSLPSQVDALAAPTAGPSREDAVLLRLCKIVRPRSCTLRSADIKARESSILSRGSKRPWTASQT